MTPTPSTLEEWFREHRAYLWGVSYRVTGSAADADDVVQDTFTRAQQHAPDVLEDPRRWLTRVAVNLARDVLRRRKRRRYVGPWLPTPIETDERQPPPSYEPAIDGRTLEGRYDLMESVSIAFLQALEALTPTQRAVLLLCDVFDYSAGETGVALALSEGNVRVIHHRARKAMTAYDERRIAPTVRRQEQTTDALKRFLALLAAGDVQGIEQMLAADVRAVTDGGGEFTAAKRPIVGVAQVARFFLKLSQSRPARPRTTIRVINGLPAALLEFEGQLGKRPPRLLLGLNLDRAGRIVAFHVIVNRGKLASLAIHV